MPIIFLSFLLCCCFKKTGRKENGCYERKANLATSLASPLGEEGHGVAQGCTTLLVEKTLYANLTAKRQPSRRLVFSNL